MLGLLGAVMAGPNLVPAKPSTAPDYFCTWNIQGYVCSYTGADKTRAEMNEESLFGSAEYRCWVALFSGIRKDLILVMDDSWDVPPSGDPRAFGRLHLDEQKFPSFKGGAAKGLAKLSEWVRQTGWRGVGGWVCAQESPLLPAEPMREYWADRLRELGEGGMMYLKVDWGKHSGDLQFRQMLEQLKPSCCPNTLIEAAITPGALRFADTYRTYDVETVISAPTTIARIADLMSSARDSPTILNCEDEVYIGAALGCSYGIMRHPFAGPLPDGRQDFVFPSTCRDLKARMDEVARAVRWHRIAAPFPIGQAAFLRSTAELTDRWTIHDGESWIAHRPGSIVSASAPAILARGMPLPRVKCDKAEPPFVVAARYPNGCVSVATIGRALGRTYQTPRADVSIEGAVLGRPIGVFGHFRSLSISFGARLHPKAIWAQDLASNRSEDILKRVQIKGNTLTLPGSLIERIGLSAAGRYDPSDPGLVLVVKA